jgi:NTE family protein
MKLGLVLGAGGVVGMSYHAGVLHALAVEGGLDARRADLVVGTSAGSVVGALLRSGVSPEEIWDLVHENQAEATFERVGGSPLATAARAVGSAYVATRSLVRVPAPRIPGFVARHFPAGVYGNQDLRDRLAEVLPDEWPDDPLWLVAVDVQNGRRVVLRKRGSTGATLHEAVLASCAIPGVFPPVRVGARVMVDGGAHSTTHLDLAATWGCDTIIGVVPMAYDPTAAPDAMRQLVRRTPARSVAREARFARARGADVVLVRPCAEELQVHGIDLMRPADAGAVARAAYECTARQLDTPRFRRLLDGVGGPLTEAA